MAFLVITTGETKLVPPNNIEVKKDSITLAPANLTLNKKVSVICPVAGAGAQLTVDLTPITTKKGMIFKASAPVDIQLTGGANPALVNVTDFQMRGEISSLIVTNNQTEAVDVELIVYGNS